MQPGAKRSQHSTTVSPVLWSKWGNGRCRRGPDTLLAPRLGDATIIGVREEPVGTGQMSESRRLLLDYSQPCGLPDTMIAKFESASENE